MKAVVSLNSGSSSIKFALFTVDEQGLPTLSAGGKIEKIGIAPHLEARSADGVALLERDWADGAALTHADLLRDLFAWASDHLDDHEVIAVGHRVVHGGTEFAAPRLVDAALIDKLDALCPLAPLHQPHNLAAIRAIAELRPDLPQVACFDTAFHHDMPAVASRFALPRTFHEQGIRRYGFHGLSYEYIARRLAEIDPVLASGRVIAAHLGNGASLCAMRAGKSVDTTMGFTTLDGLMMGSRSGSLDPGVVLHLQMQLGMSAAEVEELLYKKSGLLGVSGLSSDMRTLSQSGAPEAEEAIELFCWRAAREAGGLIASLGGLDAIVFTAGIGENHADVRSRICRRLAWLGVEIDELANAGDGPRITVPDSPVAALVIPTDEERMIALHALDAAKRITGTVMPVGGAQHLLA
ncbi:acetate/propionate family kinase [Sphingopyxis indica]|uniref:acetate/propionate family kinase n=1 Tax=Sphingopyxis indica TaxID=436663 RepID=UPI002939045A|nr:acetate/propionate family kinase [Sphingopyxis indica]WOF45015.1 acetate/propionate family kinase [Sphingopyxis indica]